MKRDELFSSLQARSGDFRFDQEVVDVFPDMISRSVPGYGSVLALIAQLTKRFAVKDSRIYDLGCSLGAGTFILRKSADPSCQIIAVDNSAAMVSKLRSKLAEDEANKAEPGPSVELIESDIQSIEISNASFVLLNWTLQFIAAAERDDLLKQICDGMLPGGTLLLSEKICCDDEAQNNLLIELHHDFKRANGYSDLEIAQKRTALENTLIPEPLAVHVARLQAAGFSVVTPWFQCFNFASILAVK